MKEAIRYLDGSFYLHLIPILFAFVGLFASLKKRSNNNLKIFTLYFSAYIISQLSLYLHVCFFFKGSFKIYFVYTDYYLDYTFTILEFLIFTSFFRIYIRKIKNLFEVLISSFLFISTTLVINDLISVGHPVLTSMNNLFTIQAIYILPGPILYFTSIFKTSPSLLLWQQPTFWVAVGTAFFMVCTLPCSLVINYLIENNYTLYKQLFSIFYIFYALLFFMIIKAFLCIPSHKN
jgi:hypothetical protein